MDSYQINIINPKALKILKDLADLELISFKKTEDESLQKILKRIRENAGPDAPSLEEITREVELVREKRYASKKG